MKIKLARNKQGTLQITHPTNLGLVADFLETDVNDNLEYCQEILTAITNINKCPYPNHQENLCSNLYELIIRHSEALLLNLHDEKVAPARIKLKELSSLLEAWQKEINIEN
jgi:uncharacterized protein YacL (UPF0231 family)